MTDQQLVRDFAQSRSDRAFGELVRRHIDLVYSAAMRMVRDAHLTEDVTQGVFLALAQNARNLTDRPVLSGWLHRTAQNLAANAIRSEVRRRVHEQEAAVMNELLSADPEASWEDIAPHLDAALGELEEPDRDALMLRYFEKKSAPEMAGQLGISEEAAQKRVRRAVERLRAFFTRRGITVGATGLVLLLTANAVQSAPLALAASVSTAALAGAATSTSTLITATKIIAMTSLQKAVVAITVTVLAGAGIFEARQASQLRQEVQSLQNQTPLTDQVRQLQRERDDATNRLAALASELASLKKSPAELLKLRGEVGALRQEKASLGSKSALNKITADPEMRKNLRDQQKIGMTAIYSDLSKSLNLTPQQSAQFNDALADNIMDSIDLITQALHDHKSRAEIDQMFASQNSTLNNQLQAILGPEGLAQYQDYTKNLINTLTVSQFAGDLTGDADAVAAKKSQLLQVMQGATQSTLAAAGLPPDYQTVPMLNMGNIASEDEGNQSVQVLDSIYAQAASQASSFLTPDELGKFQTYRTNAIQNSQTMLQMNRNLMAPISE
ncbi:MAG TPA: sigma-70 family RNA polymerase sigma factor [Candidatus Acidoferrales bacterium]|nr:sigma-70 family RNA polymerase sigma factor [Candidatus Acidoferrales bacterium]